MNITRRSFVAGAAAAAAAAAAWRFWPQKLDRPRPNIILFIADDMRWDAAGFMGNKIVQTPHLDRLAKDSFVFSNHFVTTSVCSISRASMLTGMYLRRHRIAHAKRKLGKRLSDAAFPQLLKNRGYYTGFVGKWGMGGEPKEMFDRWHGYRTRTRYTDEESPLHATDRQTGQALDFLGGVPERKPFFLMVSYYAPHAPFAPQPQTKELYADMAIPRAATDTGNSFEKLPRLLKTSRGRHEYIKENYADDEAYQESVRNYYRLITGLDASVGQVVEKLEAMQVLDNSCILFTSDNGMMLGDRGLLGKWCMYEESIRAPLLAKLPRHFHANHPPRRIAAESLNIDIAPTLLSLAGIPVPKSVQGRDLLSPVVSPQAKWRGGFYYEHPAIPSGSMVGSEGWRTGEWKYTRYFLGGKKNEVLFDLKNDPQELVNLIKRRPKVAKRMRAEVKKARKRLR